MLGCKGLKTIGQDEVEGIIQQYSLSLRQIIILI